MISLILPLLVFIFLPVQRFFRIFLSPFVRPRSHARDRWSSVMGTTPEKLSLNQVRAKVRKCLGQNISLDRTAVLHCPPIEAKPFIVEIAWKEFESKASQ